MKEVQKRQARALRSAGESIKGIARTLGVSQGSVSKWCGNMRLTDAHQHALAERQRLAGRTALASLNEARKKAKLEDMRTQRVQGAVDTGEISDRDLFMIGLGLYWGEGYKRGNQEWEFTNGDPAVIRLIMAWLATCYGVSAAQMGARLTINAAYRDESDQLHREWCTITGIPATHFSQPSFISSYGKPGGDLRTYRGTLRIKVKRGTSLRRRILASIEAASVQITRNSRKMVS